MAAIGVGFLQGVHRDNAAAGVGYADSYWTQFWLTGYQDGYVRRSLLGTLVQMTLAPGTGVGILSAVQLALSALLLGSGMLIVGEIMRRATSVGNSLTCAAIFGFSPVGPLLFETTGDPLHAATLVWLGGLLVSMRLREGPRLAILVAGSVVAMMIHEAAAFFVLPHLLLTAPGIRSLPTARRTVLVAAMVALVAFAITLLASDSAGVPRFFLTNTVNQGRIVPARLATPAFSQVFRQEMHDSFAGIGGTVRTIARALRFMLVPCAIVAFLATFDPRKIVMAPLFAVWVVCSAPLYIIAHDWGRFGILTLYFVLATGLVEGSRVHLGRAGAASVAVWRQLGDRLLRSQRDLRIARALIATTILSTTVIWDEYRVAGGRPSLFVACVVTLFGVIVYWRRGPIAPIKPATV